MEKNEKYKIIGNFFEIVSGLKNKKEVVDFFLGLLTPSEVLMAARRIQIAQMLLEEGNYEIIRKRLKVSNQTITKTDRWLHRDEDYNRWLKTKLKTREEKRKEIKDVLDKYPQYRFLRNILG